MEVTAVGQGHKTWLWVYFYDKVSHVTFKTETGKLAPGTSGLTALDSKYKNTVYFGGIQSYCLHWMICCYLPNLLSMFGFFCFLSWEGLKRSNAKISGSSRWWWRRHPSVNSQRSDEEEPVREACRVSQGDNQEDCKDYSLWAGYKGKPWKPISTSLLSLK